ncbi:MAG: fructosamine kinase family protein [Solirubrobacterales bacterium]
MQSLIQEAVREALGDPGLLVGRLVAAGGGCISHATRVETSSGDFFVKWNEACAKDLFLREAQCLRELAAAGSDLVVPRVFGAWEPDGRRPAMIVMEYLPPARAAQGQEALGRGLAAVHRSTADRFGFSGPTYCGATRQDNTWTAAWVEFYRERRLRAILRMVEDERGLDPAERRAYERVLERLPELLPHDPLPALNHGDLWSGNVLQTARGPALVDPACAWADREMEMGIVTLFGGFGEGFWRAYDEAWPLEPGWRERNPVYQLYHVLNHCLLFGGHYRAQALAIALRYA